MVERASRAIEGLPPTEPWRTVAYYLRGSAELLLGLDDEAAADVAACRELSQQVPIPHLLAFALGTRHSWRSDAATSRALKCSLTRRRRR